MSLPQLDKIIGSSAISHSSFDVHYSSSVCAFPSHGFLSFIMTDSCQRFDIKISDNFREISALKFSMDANQIAVGESGPNSQIFILSFNDSFNKIISKTEINTKENGFSALALHSINQKLISVGADYQPFFILWGLGSMIPIKIGFYHLPKQPNKVIFTSDCNMAVVAGESLLKIVDTSISYQGKISQLKTRKANLGLYEDCDFVDVCCTNNKPHHLYALCREGTLCFYESFTDPFVSRTKNSRAPLVLTPIRLNRGFLTSLAIDENLVLCGSEKGPIFALSYENKKHKLSGKLVAIPEKVLAVGISRHYIASAYNDGHILYWKKDQMDKPELTSFNHRGPICKLCVIQSTGQVITCGSDNSIRLWELQWQRELISKSSQEMLFCRRFDSPENDYMTNYCGVRATTYLNDLIFAGCNDGNIHIIKMDTFDEIGNFIDNIDSVNALSSRQNLPYFASGGGDGYVRLYSIDNYEYRLIGSKSAFSSPVTSLVFTDTVLVASSANGIKFYSLPDFQEVSYFPTQEPVLSLAYIEKANLIVSAGCDRCISFFDSKSGKLFNKYLLSNSYYPVTVDVHPSGLVIAAALSDGNVIIIDTITGDTLFSFDSLMGIVTSIAFHETDLIISSFSGCFARWNLPNSFHKEIDTHHSQIEQSPVFDLLNSKPAKCEDEMKNGAKRNSSDNEEDYDDTDDRTKSDSSKPSADDSVIAPISNSLIGSRKLIIPSWGFQNDQASDPLKIENIEGASKEEEKSSDDNDNDDDDDNKNQNYIDVEADRPPQKVMLADAIIRSSIRPKKSSLLSIPKVNVEQLNDKDNEVGEENKKEQTIEVLRIPNSRPRNSNLKNISKPKNKGNVITPLNPEEIEGCHDMFNISSSEDENEHKIKDENRNDKNTIKDDTSIEKVEDDNISSESKEKADNQQKKGTKTLASEMKETADELKSVIESAKAFLMMTFTDSDDIEAQKQLREIYEALNTQKKRKEEIKAKIQKANIAMAQAMRQAEETAKSAFVSVEQFSLSFTD